MEEIFGLPFQLCTPLLQGVTLYSRDNRELDLLLFREVYDFVSRVDRVLSRPGGSMLLAGRSGVGRHTVTSLVSHMHGYTLFTPKMPRGYSLKHFSNDLKTVMGDSFLPPQFLKEFWCHSGCAVSYWYVFHVHVYTE